MQLSTWVCIASTLWLTSELIVRCWIDWCKWREFVRRENYYEKLLWQVYPMFYFRLFLVGVGFSLALQLLIGEVS